MIYTHTWVLNGGKGEEGQVVHFEVMRKLWQRLVRLSEWGRVEVWHVAAEDNTEAARLSRGAKYTSDVTTEPVRRGWG